MQLWLQQHCSVPWSVRSSGPFLAPAPGASCMSYTTGIRTRVKEQRRQLVVLRCRA
jgi:hypothetical protein